MKTWQAALSVAVIVLAACSPEPDAQRSTLASGFYVASIVDHFGDQVGEIDCVSPGGGGGSEGQGPHGEPLAHHQAFITCRYPDGNLDQLAAAVGSAGTAYLASVGISAGDPGSYAGEGIRGLTWQYTFGDATGLLSLMVVPIDDTDYRIVGNLVEYGLKP